MAQRGLFSNRERAKCDLRMCVSPVPGGIRHGNRGGEEGTENEEEIPIKRPAHSTLLSG